MADRFTKGFIAGAVSGLVITLLNMLIYTSGIYIVRWVDWMGIILFDRMPVTLGEILLSLVAMVSFNGALGIAFFYLIPLITNKNLMLKGWLWGVSVWFALDAITSLFKIDGLINPPLVDAITNYVSASLYGLFLAQLQERFERVGVAASLKLQPSMKPLDRENKEDE
jgi:hypothetical protein